MKKILATAALMIAVSTSAFAAPVYMGVDVGQVQFASGGVESSPLATRAVVGTSIAPNVDVEGELVLGAGSDSVSVNGRSTPFQTSVGTGFGAFIRPHVELTPGVQLYGRLGVSRNTVKLSYRGETVRGSETEAAVGLGVGFAVTKQTSIVLDATRYGDTATAISIGYRTKF